MTTEPDLSDDQHTRLRALLDEAEFPPPWDDLVQGATNRALAVAAANALPALLAENDRLRGIVRDVAGEALPYDTVQTGYASSIYVCVFCEEQRHHPHDETCPWRRAREVFPDA